ncbi:probable RNA-directed DNA polymerase from transposon BS [Diabrotica virgifera virgifera]|uniref:Reverse transcriptase domain-containing protein n=1 Tax=Diabrotica virgifera virgifera TaxID=50390 RepID=A0ABM5KCK8_DIAVI|nr:probable RNA-directed DNA polymerase from transposon BS [Diabrotica virgifera virgifera]
MGAGIVDTTLYFDARNPYFDNPITTNEIYLALNSCQNNKAPGSDNIPYEFYKYLPNNWILYLNSFFNTIFNTSTFPNSWSKITLKMLHKKGPSNDPSNYRGIALVNCITKVFMQIILNRLVNWVESFNILPESQSGFRKERGCYDNVYTLTSIIQFRLRFKKRKLFVLFVDFKRAFDCINHALLWSKLFALGISSKIVLLLKSFYSNATFRVNADEQYTKSFNICEGVLQGEVLSPLLFALFLADIEDFFKSRGAEGINVNNVNETLMLLYADDLVILGHSEIDISKKLKMLEDYCKQNKLTVNTAKTKIMCFSRGPYNLKNNIKFTFNQYPILLTNTYNYLGVTFASSSLFREMADVSNAKAKQATGALIPVLAKLKIDCMQTRLQLFDALVTSTISNCISVWALRYVDVLEQVQVQFLKRILMLPISTPGYIVRVECGRVKLLYNIFKWTLNWLKKIYMMDDSRYPKMCFFRQLQLMETDSREESYNESPSTSGKTNQLLPQEYATEKTDTESPSTSGGIIQIQPQECPRRITAIEPPSTSAENNERQLQEFQNNFVEMDVDVTDNAVELLPENSISPKVTLDYADPASWDTLNINRQTLRTILVEHGPDQVLSIVLSTVLIQALKKEEEASDSYRR